MSELNFQVFDNGHSILSPSGWGTWSTCTGSTLGLNEYRKIATDNIPSVEGTTAHTLLELCLIQWKHPTEVGFFEALKMGNSFKDDVEMWCNKITNNINNTEEVIDFAKECFRQIKHGDYTVEMRSEVARCYERIKVYKDDGWTIIPESKVSLFAYFGHHHSDGSSDVIMYKGRRLIVVDLKYGKGIEVAPRKNGQLSLYAGGAIAFLYEKTGEVFESIQLVIMQPRINDGVWKTWDWFYSGEGGLYEFLQQAKVKSDLAIEALQGGEISFNPSETSCMWCHRRKTGCKAREDHANALVKEAFAAAGLGDLSTERPDGVTNQGLSDIMNRAPFCVSFFKDMIELAEKRARSGQRIPDRKLVKGRSSRKWKEPDNMSKVMLSMDLSPEDYLVANVKSVAQMDGVKLTDGQKATMKSHVIKSFGKEPLVSTSDPRPEVIKNVAQAFQQAGVGNSK